MTLKVAVLFVRWELSGDHWEPASQTAHLETICTDQSLHITNY